MRSFHYWCGDFSFCGMKNDVTNETQSSTLFWGALKVKWTPSSLFEPIATVHRIKKKNPMTDNGHKVARWDENEGSPSSNISKIKLGLSSLFRRGILNEMIFMNCRQRDCWGCVQLMAQLGGCGNTAATESVNWRYSNEVTNSKFHSPFVQWCGIFWSYFEFFFSHDSTSSYHRRSKKKTKKEGRQSSPKADSRTTSDDYAASNHSNIDNAIMTHVHLFPPTHGQLSTSDALHG